MMNRLMHVLAIVVLWAAPTFGNITLFEARFDYDIDSPNRITGADLDNDGDHDLIVTVSGSGGIKIMLNNGDGLYAAPVPYSSGYSTSNIIPGDFDGDNDTDLVLVSTQDTSRVLFNDGSGNFSLVVGAGLPREILDGFAADLDGDGDYDLVLESSWPFIYIYLNDGTGEFTYLDMYIPCDMSMDVFGGDLDGDGDIDMAVADPADDSIRILLNNGDATFTASTSFGVGDIMARVEGGDFDGDGDCDLIIDHGNVALMLNNGDATFAAPVDIEPALYSLTACTDYDGDGDIDLMGAFWDENFIYVQFLSNNGDATFSEMAAYPSTPDFSIYGADVDNDGDVDLAMTFFAQNKVSVILGNGEGDFPQARACGDSDVGFSVSGSDLDGDGDLDLVGISPGQWLEPFGWYIPGSLELSLNNGDGTYAISDPIPLIADPVSHIESDLDGDNDCDIAVVCGGDNALKILSNDGAGSFTSQHNYQIEGYVLQEISGADFDNDGDSDLAVVFSDVPSYNIAIFYNNGDGSFLFGDSLSAGDNVSSIICSDLNGDGYPDLVTTNYSGDVISYVSIYMNNGDGTFGTAASYDVGIYPFDVYAADYDGDMVVDLAVSCQGTPEFPYHDCASVAILFGVGDGSFTIQPEYYLEEYGGATRGLGNPIGADFDADGDCDLAVPLTSDYYVPDPEPSGRIDRLMVLLNDGAGNFSDFIAYGAAFPAYLAYPDAIGYAGDVDGDGDIDLVAGNMIFINTTNGGSCTGDSDCDGVSDAVDNCLHMDNPNQADTDGDGVGDMCDICPGYDDLADSDGDYAPDSCDNCPTTYNPEQDNTDTDADGVPDLCDICAGFDDNLDSDGDGIPDGCDAVCGDANGDRDVNIGDAVHIINYIFKGGLPPDPLCCGDAGGDEAVNIGDAVYLINFIFKSGPPPVVACCPQPPVKRQQP